MNITRSIFGAVLVAGALTALAAFELWPRAQLSLPPIETPQKAGASATESVVQEFAEWPRSIHTVPVPVAPQPPAVSAPVQPPPALPPRVATDLAAPVTLPSHAQPVDVCAPYGGHRIDFMRGHHAMWRCVYPRRR
jgi:hypothetical protein